jgi:hypothetical protein
MADKKVQIDIIARDKSQQALRSVQGGLEGVKRRVFNLRNALIGIGGAAVLKGFLDAGIEVENLGVQLKALFGSAEAGAKALEQVTKFAATTPFELRNIQQGVTALATVADKADEMGISFEELLKITGNTAVQLGGDFAQASLNIQKSFSAGIGSADLFRDRAVTAMAGFEAGVKVSVDESIRGLQRAFGSGGEFGNLTQELSETAFGSISNLKDAFFQFQVAVSEGFFPALKSGLGDLKKSVAENNVAIKEFGNSVGENLVKGFKRAKEILDAIQPPLDLVFQTIKGLIDGFLSLPQWVQTTGIIGAVLGGAAGFGILVSLSAIAKAIKDISGGVIIDSKESYDKILDEVVKLKDELKDLQGVQTIEAEKRKIQLESQIIDLETLLKTMREYNSEVQKQKPFELFTVEDTHPIMIINKELTFMQKLFAELDERAEKFSKKMSVVKQTADIVGNAFKTMKQAIGDAFADAILQTKSFQESLRALGQTILRQVISGIVQIALEVFIFDRLREKIKEMNGELGKSSRLMAHLKLTQEFGIFGFLGGFALPTPRAAGGNVRAGQPYMVGEAGHEMFVPSQNGNIVPNNQLGGGQNINITINANDTQGFDELLVKRRATIVNVINDALNSQGKEALV